MTEEFNMNPTQPIRELWQGLQPGVVLAERYRVERLINRGGMGAVFEATQLGLDRSVAIKVLLPMLSRDEKMKERFRREARSAASLRHPNIIQIYDYGISDYGPYIVMELVRGHSLREMLRKEPMQISQCVNLMSQICSAISAAHAAEIIHRDLKPDNILIEEFLGGSVTVKVLDFGIAKIREGQIEESDANLTGANIIGSPAYMSPEQCHGHQLDGRSDIYSLGILFYEMLTGVTPFGKLSPAAMMLHHIGTHPERPSRIRGDVPDGIEAVLARALAKDRELRFSSANQFAEHLRDALENPHLYDTQITGFSTLDGFDTAVAPDKNGSGLPSGSYANAQRKRLAIMPLRNLAGDPEIEFLGFALADSVITQLAPIKSLIVRPSSAIEKYRNVSIDPRAVGRELQVDTLLSGSYLKAGDLFRLNVQLIDVHQNEILWQERIDLKFDNVLSLQDRICEELIRGLRLNITTGEQEALKRDEARNPMAYELYLRGLGFGTTTEEHKQAVDMLEASVSLDATYAPAWAALAGRYINARNYLQDETFLPKAEKAARKALDLNNQLPAAFFWLALYYGEIGDLKNALVICKQLISAAPNSEYAYQAMGHAYDYAGLPEIALTLFRKAVEINPVAYPYMLGFLHYQKRNFADARKELESCPDSVMEKHFWLSAIDLIEGNRDKAIERLESLVSKGHTGLFHSQTRGLLFALKGEKEKGIALMNAALASDRQLGSYHYYIAAEILAQLGDSSKAIEMLQGALKNGYGNYPFLMSDPLLDPIRSDEGFQQIASNMQKLQSQLQLMLVTG